jgi:4-amino-4-deoxy-L-arabinose transferase-like glycosyltransferase
MAWRPVVGVAAGIVVLLLAFSNEYGYQADELYFRMLGEHGLAWGYVDQPPLLPALVHLAASILGDSLWAIRVPASLCAAALIVVGAMIAAELGGSRRAQVMTAFGLGTSTEVLSIGHWILTTSVDMVSWSVVLLFALRALLREDGRWWLAAGAACGLATYAKPLILLLPIALFPCLLLIGPRSVFRDRRLYLGGALTLVIGAPNFLYQLLNNIPQLQMAQSLGATDGSANRELFFTNLIFLFGPVLVVFWIIGLIKLFREPSWRPVRALALSYILATTAAFLVAGGRPDYTGGFLIAVLAVGCVIVDRWMGRRKLRLSVVAFGVVLTVAAQIYVSLPVIPLQDVATLEISSMSLESVGWPTLVAQVGKAYHQLPSAERSQAVVLAEDYGEAGAVDRFGKQYGLPKVYSGNNQLYSLGPPPESAHVVVAVGFGSHLLKADFAECQVVAHVNNGLGVDNPEQGQPITLCSGRRASWASLWPSYRYLAAYP